MIQRIPTYRSRARRAGAAVWQAIEQHPWIVYSAIAVLVAVANIV